MAKAEKEKQTGVSGNERIVAFSDGVFAIVITLLVLEVKVPEIAADLVAEDLPHALNDLWPKVLSHVTSFAVLGVYWVGHHTMFMYIKRHDRVLLWLNILFLLFVSSMPFPTGLLGQYSDQQIALVIYCGVLILVGLAAIVMWWYATGGRRLVDEDIDPTLIALIYRRGLLTPAINLAAIFASFVSLGIAKLLVVIAILIYIVPNPLTYRRGRSKLAN
jgi:uncharacterized membrane protein